MRERKLNPIIVANYFLTKEPMTQKKLQKLTYYAYVQYIIENNDELLVDNFLFQEKPEAWLHGPVFPTLYQEYKMYNWKLIPMYKNIITLPECIKELLDKVYEEYKNYSADELEYKTHCEKPWQDARKNVDVLDSSNEIITPQSIYEYYS